MPTVSNRPAAPTSQSRRAKPLAATIATLALLAAGCGSSSPASPGSASPASFTAAAFRYSSCMRDHGLPDYPDPMMTDHNGQQVAYLAVSIPIDPSPSFKSARKACRGVLPAPDSTSAAQLAQQQRAREQHILAFAKCVRGHGIRNFPDPTGHGQLTPGMISAAGVDLKAPAVLAAAKACLASAGGAITSADVQRTLNGNQ